MVDDTLAMDDVLADDPAAAEDAQRGIAHELEEVEHDGQFYRIPAPLKGAFLMNADYTRKTQELAEHRRAVEAERAALADREGAIRGTVDDRARLRLLDHHLEAFEEADWELMASEDPEGAQAAWQQFQATREARDDLVAALAHQEERGQLEAARARAAQLEETGRVLAQEIEGWSPEVAAKLVEYGQAFGVTLDELRQVADPRIWKVLHRAHQGEELLKQREAARNAERTQAVRPAVQVTGGAAGSGGVRDELGAAEWMKRRNDQVLRGR